MTATACGVHVRWMIARDLPAVTAIEARSFPEPWDEATFLRVLRHKRDHIAMVVESRRADDVLGHMVYQLSRDGLTVVNLAVDPAYRLCGVGRVMVRKLCGKLHEGHRRRWVQAVVNERNAAAVGLFRSCGFTARLAPGEYGDDDGIEFVYRERGDE